MQRETFVDDLFGDEGRRIRFGVRFGPQANEEIEGIMTSYGEKLESFEEADVQEMLRQLDLGKESEKTSDTNGDVKVTRAQRRRAKKREKMKERDAKRREEKEQLAKMGPRAKELRLLEAKLDRDGLFMKEVASDGHCMYRAISQQLGAMAEIGYSGLRRIAAKYMRENSEDFLPFFVSKRADESHSATAFETYCANVESTSTWGGQLELQALAHALKRPIKVYSSDAPVLTMGDTDSTSKPLRVTFHRHYYSLGEHYNAALVKP